MAKFLLVKGFHLWKTESVHRLSVSVLQNSINWPLLAVYSVKTMVKRQQKTTFAPLSAIWEEQMSHIVHVDLPKACKHG